MKKRHGISIQAEKLSADVDAMVEFCYDLENITEYNLISYWKAMQKRTLAVGSENSVTG